MNLEGFIGTLARAGYELDAEGLLDTLWLASLGRTLSLHETAADAPQSAAATEFITPDAAAVPAPPAPAADKEHNPPTDPPARPAPPSASPTPGQAPVYARGSPSAGDRTIKASPFSVPIGRALPGRLPLMRSLRPLSQRWPSTRHPELDEERTVDATAQLRMVLPGAINPVFRPGRERWFDAELVLEDDAGIELWADTLREFAQMLRETGAFRLVRSWRLRMPARDDVRQRAWLESTTGARVPSTHLTGSGVRRLVIVATHGASSRWRDGSYAGVLKPWLQDGSVLLLQLMPRERWAQTRLGEPQALVHTTRAGASGAALEVNRLWWLLDDDAEDSDHLLPLPAVPLQPAALHEWARMQMSRGRHCAAYLLDPTPRALQEARPPPLEREHDFERAIAQLRRVSPQGFRLAVALSTSVFTIPVARLVQAARLGSGGDLSPLAELLQSGLVTARRDTAQAASPYASTQYYEFRPEAQRLLLRSLRDADARQLAQALQEQVSHYIRQISGSQITTTQLIPDEQGRYDLPEWAQPFAQVATSLLGGAGPLPSPEEAFDAFVRREPPAIVGAAARLASTGALVTHDHLDEALWQALRNGRLVEQDAEGRWRFNPQIAPLLMELDKRQPLLGASVLWVDDVPQGNEEPRARFAAWGLSIHLATSTEEALARLGREPFDAVISDMVRGRDGNAGLDLLARLRRHGNDIPFIVFAGISAQTRRNAVMAAGAFGCTNQQSQLYELVRQAIRGEPPAPGQTHEESSLNRVREVVLRLTVGSAVLLTARLEGGPASLARGVMQQDDGLALALKLMHAYGQANDSQIAIVKSGRLEVVADIMNPAPRTQVIPWEGLVGECAQSGRVVWAPDVSLASRYVATNKSTRSELVVPVFDQRNPNRVTAVVNMELTALDGLSSQQIDWLASFAENLSPLLPSQERKVFIDFEPDDVDDAGLLVRELRIEYGVAVERYPSVGEAVEPNAHDALLICTTQPTLDFEDWRNRREWGGLPAGMNLMFVMLSSRLPGGEELLHGQTVFMRPDRSRALAELAEMLGVSKASQQKQVRAVTVLYATNRERRSARGAGEARYTNVATHHLEFGECEVNVPPAHVMGILETPSLLRLQLRANRDKHFLLESSRVLATGMGPAQTYLRTVDGSRPTVIYVHGFNLDFEHSVLRAAQISVDLGLPVLVYAWASQGNVTSYLADHEAARASAGHLSALLDDLPESGPPVHLWADGLGALLAIEAMDKAQPRGQLQHLVFTRADVAYARFASMVDHLRRFATTVTSYVSSTDPFAPFAQQVHPSPRVATLLRPMMQADVIDMSDAETGIAGLQLSGVVLRDIRLLLVGQSPDRRPGLQARDSDEGRLWRMVPQGSTDKATTRRPKPKLYFSYVKGYQHHAEALAERLEEDLDVRWDRHLESGSDWSQRAWQMLEETQAVIELSGPLTDESPWVMQELSRSVSLGKQMIRVAVAPLTGTDARPRVNVANVDERGEVRYLQSLAPEELKQTLDRTAISILHLLEVDAHGLASELRHTHTLDPTLHADPSDLRSRGRRLEGDDFRTLVAQLQDNERLVGHYRPPLQAETARQIPSRRALQLAQRERDLDACYALDRSLLHD